MYTHVIVLLANTSSRAIWLNLRNGQLRLCLHRQCLICLTVTLHLNVQMSENNYITFDNAKYNNLLTERYITITICTLHLIYLTIC